MPDPSITYTGPLYRALNPVWARDPLSGEGARRHGGRFNAPGTPALYTALSVMGAVAEANQIGRPFEPVTLVSFDAEVPLVLDAQDPASGIDPGVLAADNWRLQMREGGLSGGQRLAAGLMARGYRGMIVQSHARGAPPGARNLVLWDWTGCLRVIDTEGRLSPN